MVRRFSARARRGRQWPTATWKKAQMTNEEISEKSVQNELGREGANRRERRTGSGFEEGAC